MEVLFNTFNAIALFGVIQGLIALLFLLFQKGEWSVKLYLSFMLFALSNILITNTLNEVLQRNQEPNIYWHFNWAISLGPSLYLYISSYLNKKIYQTPIIHYLPFIGINTYLMIQFLIHLDQPQQFQALFLTHLPFAEIISLSLTTIYIIQSGIWVFQKSLKSFEKKWLSLFWGLVTLLSMLWMVYAIIDHYLFNYNLSYTDYYPLDTLVVMMLYIIGIGIFSRSQIYQPKASKLVKPIRKTYRAINSDEIAQKINRLQQLMDEDHIYLNPNLSLETLAQQINTHPKTLSFILNEEIGKNFNDYINDFRVNEVKKRLVDPSHSHFTLLAIAYDCGFQSKSTFNTVFKKSVGITPSAYRKKHLQTP